MTTPDEQTHGKAEALRALASTREKAKRTDEVIRQSEAALRIMQAHVDANGYVAKFRAIIRGDSHRHA